MLQDYFELHFLTRSDLCLIAYSQHCHQAEIVYFGLGFFLFCFLSRGWRVSCSKIFSVLQKAPTENKAVKATFAETSALSYFGNLLGWSLGTLRNGGIYQVLCHSNFGLRSGRQALRGKILHSCSVNPLTASQLSACLFLPAPPKVQAAVHKLHNNAQIILSFSTVI